MAKGGLSNNVNTATFQASNHGKGRLSKRHRNRFPPTSKGKCANALLIDPQNRNLQTLGGYMGIHGDTVYMSSGHELSKEVWMRNFRVTKF